jgi:hypothetical protein
MLDTGIKFQQPPRPVGAYWIGGVGIGLGVHMTRRPAWLHRLLMRWAFGWVWVDEPHG